MKRPANRRSIMQQLLDVVFNKKSGKTRQLTVQRPILPQGASKPLAERTNTLSVEPKIFERMEEYQAILEHHAQLSARRQHTNDVYIGLNTVFLTAIGLLLLQSHLDTWWIFAVVSAITIIVLPINVTWRLALLRYGKTIAARYDYLREIEQEFRTRRGNIAHQPQIGFFSRFKENGLQGKGNTELEIRLVTYFICLYPALSLVVGILVYLVETGLIPPLKLL